MISGQREIRCPAGEWTTILSTFAKGMAKDWVVTFTSDDGGTVEGEALEQKSLWIFPRTPGQQPLANRMTFHRDWMNALYWVKVKPSKTVIASLPA